MNINNKKNKSKKLNVIKNIKKYNNNITKMKNENLLLPYNYLILFFIVILMKMKKLKKIMKNLLKIHNQNIKLKNQLQLIIQFHQINI